MSYASYDTQEPPRRHKSERHRHSRRDPPVYQEEEFIESRNGPPRQRPQMDLVRRPRDDDDGDIEEVQRDFAPGDSTYKRRTKYRDDYPQRARSADRYGGSSYGDPRRSDAGAGRRSRRDDDRRGHRRKDYDSDSMSESPPPRKERRKSMSEQALAAIGLGSLAGNAADNQQGRSRNRSRGGYDRRQRSSSSDYSRSRSRGGKDDKQKKIEQAVKAALTAGAVEAFRSRKDPGGWGGDKGRRVLTAAIGAGGIDGLADKDPNKKGTTNTIQAVLGGLVTNKLVNGSRNRSQSRGGGRDRSQSRGRGGGGGGGGGGTGTALAGAGLAAAAGKALYDRYEKRDKSRGRGRRDSSESSYDSRSPPRNKRSKSVTDYVRGGMNKGMAALGLGEKQDDRGSRDNRVSRRGDDDGYSQQGGARLRGGGGEEKRGGSSSSSSKSSEDEISSSEDERRVKKMKGKEYLTAGLASVATIHAAHSVYQSMENRDKRHKEVAEGKMSPEEAKKKKNKARLQDAASIGIAALGIKGAFSEWKEMKEMRDETIEYDHKRLERHEKRLKKRGSTNDGGSNGSYRNSEPNLGKGYQNGYGSGPRYQDGNPYSSSGALPPPPMGPPPTRY